MVMATSEETMILADPSEDKGDLSKGYQRKRALSTTSSPSSHDVAIEQQPHKRSRQHSTTTPADTVADLQLLNKTGIDRAHLTPSKSLEPSSLTFSDIYVACVNPEPLLAAQPQALSHPSSISNATNGAGQHGSSALPAEKCVLSDSVVNHKQETATETSSSREIAIIQDLKSQFAERIKAEASLRDRISKLEACQKTDLTLIAASKDISAKQKECIAGLEAQVKAALKRGDRFQKHCQEIRDSKLRLHQVSGTYFVQDTHMIKVWNDLGKNIRSLSSNIALKEVVLSGSMRNTNFRFCREAENLTPTWYKVFRARPQTLVSAVVWRYLTTTMFVEPLQLWGKPKRKLPTDFLREADMSTDEKLKKLNHCRGLIGQLHVESPGLQTPERTKTTLISELTTMLVGLMENPSDLVIRPLVTHLVDSALAICKVFIRSSMLYEVIHQIPGNQAEKTVPFNAEWMEKTLDNVVHASEGVDLVLCPGLARYGGPDAENWTDRVVMVRAEVMAEVWRDLELNS